MFREVQKNFLSVTAWSYRALVKQKFLLSPGKNIYTPGLLHRSGVLFFAWGAFCTGLLFIFHAAHMPFAHINPCSTYVSLNKLACTLEPPSTTVLQLVNHGPSCCYMLLPSWLYTAHNSRIPKIQTHTHRAYTYKKNL